MMKKNIQKNLRVAVIAPPWLAMPIKGYGGIEMVIQSLVRALAKKDIDVVLYANGEHKMRGIETRSLFNKDYFERIHEPYYETASIVQAQLLWALNDIRNDGGFDIIHDHNTHIGPMFWAMASHMKDVPPILHTFHGPSFTKTESEDPGAYYHTLDLEQIEDLGRMYMVCISEAMGVEAPEQIKPHLLAAVHNSINVKDFMFKDTKKNYYITLARFTPYKGHHTAVKLAAKLKKRLRMSGVVAGIGSNRKLLFELSNPLSKYRNNVEFKYYSDKILPFVLRHPSITFAGNMSGMKKIRFIADAKALLFPIEWEEPFGMAVIEALACGTPVVAMRRGSMPEIITHGVNGFLADNETEFEEYMQRVDEIDPANCRKSVIEKFAAESMADNYIARYLEVIKKSQGYDGKI